MHTKKTSAQSQEADDSLTPEALAGDVVLTTFKSSGPGGQKKNKTESSVRLQHLPTGIIVVATESRSQAQNRKTAWMRLMVKLRERQEKPKKRVPTRPSRAQKALRLQEKKLHSRKKQLRRTPARDD